MIRALLDTNTLSFPGLGIGEFQINNIAFSVFGRDVAWYGIIVTLAIISVCTVIYLKAKKVGISVDDMLDYFIFCIIFGVIGARLYYVIFKGIGSFVATGGTFAENLWGTLYNIVAVWEGGLAIYGGLIAVVITVIVVSKIKKIPFAKILDMGGHAALLGQAIGRWGNFTNAEAHGTETDIFCRMGIKNDLGIMHYYHPTFLYESLWNICGFALIFVLQKKKKFDGEVFLWYVIWYGLGRMFIEGLRTDSLYVGSTGIRVSQLLAFCLFVSGVVAVAVLRQRKGAVKAASEADSGDAAADEAENEEISKADAMKASSETPDEMTEDEMTETNENGGSDGSDNN